MKWNKDLIIIKDNFFDESLFKKIYVELDQTKFANRYTQQGDDKNTNQKIYFSTSLDKAHPAALAVKSFFKNELDIIIKKLDSSYFLSAKHEKPTLHDDSGSKINCIVYLKGGSLVHNGTALYENNKGTWDINSHIGFKENRMVMFSSNRKHASLQFGDGATARYLMANFIEDYELE